LSLDRHRHRSSSAKVASLPNSSGSRTSNTSQLDRRPTSEPPTETLKPDEKFNFDSFDASVQNLRDYSVRLMNSLQAERAENAKLRRENQQFLHFSKAVMGYHEMMRSFPFLKNIPTGTGASITGANGTSTIRTPPPYSDHVWSRKALATSAEKGGIPNLKLNIHQGVSGSSTGSTSSQLAGGTFQNIPTKSETSALSRNAMMTSPSEQDVVVLPGPPRVPSSRK